MRTRSLLLPALAATAIALGACGEDDQEQGSGAAATPTEQAQPTNPSATSDTPPAPVEGGVAKTIADELEATGRPKIPKQSGDAPTELQQADVKVGTGRTLASGDTVRVQYAGASWSTGEEFDASYDRGEPFEFQLGAGMVIPGWDQGVEGMKVGGRRVLVIPPDLGYGPAGSPPAIAPNETLVFVIDAEGGQ
jgi:peptidylprolyl isomerase